MGLQKPQIFFFGSLPIGSDVYYLVFSTVAVIAATAQRQLLLKHSQNLWGKSAYKYRLNCSTNCIKWLVVSKNCIFIFGCPASTEYTHTHLQSNDNAVPSSITFLWSDICFIFLSPISHLSTFWTTNSLNLTVSIPAPLQPWFLSDSPQTPLIWPIPLYKTPQPKWTCKGNPLTPDSLCSTSSHLSHSAIFHSHLYPASDFHSHFCQLISFCHPPSLLVPPFTLFSIFIWSLLCF